MPYAIELFFDASSDSKIRQLWNRLEVFGGLSLDGIGSRPHISLAVCDSVDIDGLKDLVDRFAGETPAFPVSLTRLGTFPVNPSVIYLAPDEEAELRGLQERLFAEFSGLLEGRWPYYDPEAWVPHCTLALGISGSEFNAALACGIDLELPLDCTAVALGLVEFRPVKLLHLAKLAGSGSSSAAAADP